MLLTALSGPLVSPPLGPGTTVPTQPGSRCAWCRRCWWTCPGETSPSVGHVPPQALAKTNPRTFLGDGLLRKSNVLKSDTLSVTGLASFSHVAHVPSCCLHWAQLARHHWSADPSPEDHIQEQAGALQQLEGGLVHQSFKKLGSWQCHGGSH